MKPTFKRALALLLALITLISLIACNPSVADTPNDESSQGGGDITDEPTSEVTSGGDEVTTEAGVETTEPIDPTPDLGLESLAVTVSAFCGGFPMTGCLKVNGFKQNTLGLMSDATVQSETEDRIEYTSATYGSSIFSKSGEAVYADMLFKKFPAIIEKDCKGVKPGVHISAVASKLGISGFDQNGIMADSVYAEHDRVYMYKADKSVDDMLDTVLLLFEKTPDGGFKIIYEHIYCYGIDIVTTEYIEARFNASGTMTEVAVGASDVPKK